MRLINRLVGLGLSARLSARRARLSDERYWATNSATIQRRLLRRLLRRAASTAFGKTHGFGRLAGLGGGSGASGDELLRAFRSEVSPSDISGFRSFISRMREEGEPDVLWPGVIRDYAQTSGTTAGDKFIPVSREMLRANYLAALDIFVHTSRFGVDLRRLLGGRVLFMGGSTDLTVSEHGIRTGDLSGLVAPLIRWPLSEIYSPGADIALMSHWPSKIEAMARACVRQDVRMISGMPSWMLVLFERMLALEQEGAGAHGRAGGRGMPTLRAVWPNLMLLVHGGVKYAPFEPRVRQFWSGRADGDDVPCRIELYPASEGFIAIQDRRGDPGLRLLVDNGIFFEFIPLEEIDSPSARAFACDQVERGQRYVVCMTTCAGLWRYIIGDVVEFDTIPMSASSRSSAGAGPCRLRIVGRHRHFINAFGENLIVEHIENAVAAAARRTGIVVGEFTAAPVYPGEDRRAGLELAVEVEGKPTLQHFAAAFDRSLMEQNVDYTTKRTDGVGMQPPTVTPLRFGAFHAWLHERGKLGGQHKCPRCANHRDIITQVVSAAARMQDPRLP